MPNVKTLNVYTYFKLQIGQKIYKKIKIKKGEKLIWKHKKADMSQYLVQLANDPMETKIMSKFKHDLFDDLILLLL